MSKLRHIAYRADDVEGMAQFFVGGFEMEIVQRRSNGAIDLSDGTMNVTILPAAMPRGDGLPPNRGIDHLGFTVADEAAARERLLAAGGREMATVDLGGAAHYEVKFEGPEGIVVDFGHWVGAAPIEEPAGSTTR
ncbi:MAG TPA: VOC family protein [Chloroflexota bacterium]|jgi:catechol 2,3-dioxygenase-like lactoylglutathione lyase family enzyme|nr:VOC family protein [Chloroflexota bacterium]